MLGNIRDNNATSGNNVRSVMLFILNILITRQLWKNWFRIIFIITCNDYNTDKKSLTFNAVYLTACHLEQLLSSVVRAKNYSLYIIFTTRCYASVVYAVTVRLSVRPSVRSRSSTKMAKPRITQTMAYDIPGTVCPSVCQKSEFYKDGKT